MFKIIVAICSVLFIAVPSNVSAKASAESGSSRKSMPQWVEQPSAVYPLAEYLSYVGVAADRSSAELNALNGIAGAYGQGVASVTTGTMGMEHSDDSINSETSKSSSLSQSVTREVGHEDIFGVVYKDSWTDKENKVYVLAIVNREETCDLYEAKILENNKTIAEKLKVDTDDMYTFETYFRYSSAIKLAQKNNSYLSKMTVLNYERGTTLRSSCSVESELISKRQSLVSQIPLYVNIKNDNTKDAAHTFAVVFSEKGFNTSADKNERYVLEGDLLFDEYPNSSETIQFCKYSLKVSLVDSFTGEKILSFEYSGREGAGRKEDAKKRAVNSMQKDINTQFKNSFENYLISFAEK